MSSSFVGRAFSLILSGNIVSDWLDQPETKFNIVKSCGTRDDFLGQTGRPSRTSLLHLWLQLYRLAR
jgi:hypothetical protein